VSVVCCQVEVTRPEESYRLWRVVVCDQETSKKEEAKARYRAVKIQPQWVVTPRKQTNKQTCKLDINFILSDVWMQLSKPQSSYLGNSPFSKR
jgi:hypothetical protein